MTPHGYRYVPRHRARGFTLVEVVVALTLLSLLLLGLVSALRSFGQTGTRLEMQTLANDDLRLVSALMQRTIARSSPRLRADTADEATHLWFQGGADQLEWLGQMPARNGAGGLTHLRLELAADGGLMLHMAPFDGDERSPDWSLIEARMLLDHVDALSLQYQGIDESGAEVWFDDWLEQEGLPVLVQLAITVRGRPWPPLVVRMESGESGSRVGDRNRSSLRWR